MTAMEAIQTIFKSVWDMLTSVKFPGTEMTIAMILVGAFVCILSLRIVGYVISLNIGIGGSANRISSLIKKNK